MTRLNILAGPPANPRCDTFVIQHFLSLDGWHIVCGGSSSLMVARHLETEIQFPLNHACGEGSLPYGNIGKDIFVTEGIVTLINVANAFRENTPPPKGSGEHLLYSLLLECDEINLFWGRAVNLRHPSSISFSKEKTILYLIDTLTDLNKSINVFKQ